MHVRYLTYVEVLVQATKHQQEFGMHFVWVLVNHIQTRPKGYHLETPYALGIGTSLHNPPITYTTKKDLKIC